MGTHQPTTMNGKIVLANKWYNDRLYPEEGVVSVNYYLLDKFWRELGEEREEHWQQANQYASGQTSYTDSLSENYEAWDILQQLEYQRLEANAKERRILALAATIG